MTTSVQETKTTGRAIYEQNKRLSTLWQTAAAHRKGDDPAKYKRVLRSLLRHCTPWKALVIVALLLLAGCTSSTKLVPVTGGPTRYAYDANGDLVRVVEYREVGGESIWQQIASGVATGAVVGSTMAHQRDLANRVGRVAPQPIIIETPERTKSCLADASKC